MKRTFLVHAVAQYHAHALAAHFNVVFVGHIVLRSPLDAAVGLHLPAGGGLHAPGRKGKYRQ